MLGITVNYKCPFCSKIIEQEFGACTPVAVYDNTEYILTNCKECGNKLAVRNVEFRSLFVMPFTDYLSNVEASIIKCVHMNIAEILCGNIENVRDVCYEQVVKDVKSRFKRGHKQLNLKQKQAMEDYLCKYDGQIKECIRIYINRTIHKKEELLALAFCDAETKSKAENAKIKYITEKDCSHMMTCCF